MHSQMKKLSTILLCTTMWVECAFAHGALAGISEKSVYDINGDAVVNVGDVAQLITYVTDPASGFPEAVNEQYRAMVSMEPGVFGMGASWEQKRYAMENERPLHDVTLYPFSISSHEVTQALWECVMGNNPSEHVGKNLPVENVAYDECEMFVERLRALTGINYRMPTEAEWEYAARGGMYSEFFVFSGGEDPYEVAWFSDNSGGHTHPVCQLAPNEKGLYDMGGNVAEWVVDRYATYSDAHQTNPVGPQEGSNNCVIRGGSWSDGYADCRTTRRKSMYKYYFSPTVGLRLVIDRDDYNHTPEYLIGYDVNGDGLLNVTDITTLISVVQDDM